MKVGLPLIKNVLTPLVKSVLMPLRLRQKHQQQIQLFKTKFMGQDDYTDNVKQRNERHHRDN